MSISDEVFGPLEAEETSSNIKIKNKTKKRKEKEMQSKRQKKNCYCFFLFLFFLFQGVMFKCIKFGKCFSYRYSKKPTDIYKTLEKKKKASEKPNDFIFSELLSSIIHKYSRYVYKYSLCYYLYR